jgi:hypothetical protein
LKEYKIIKQESKTILSFTSDSFALNFMPEYSKEDLWKLYASLPEELKAAVFSDENLEAVENACQKNKITDEKKITAVTKDTVQVILGLLPPNDFEQRIKEDAGLEDKEAKVISVEITRFVFIPIKINLEGLYNIKIGGEKGPEKSLEDLKKIPQTKDIKKETSSSNSADKYRENVD